ncbi:MAG: alpha/beta hydrolase [Xanthomonadales bacterium]|nr:alpha/beta hydrolase [Xanthomonadales bacterium]
MQRTVARVLAAMLAFAATAVPAAQGPAPPSPASASAISIPGTQQFDIASSSGKRSYRIFVSVPAKAAPEHGYPVLYVLDGNVMFLTALEAVRALERRPDMPKDLATVVVGIGYPDGVDAGVERTLDYTPAGGGNPQIRNPGGGADAFLAFVEDDLKPRIAGIARIDRTRQGIFGHSFGGLFVLHSLAARPDAFRVRVAASPSIWFAPKVRDELSAMVAKRKADAPLTAVLLTAGEFEQIPSPQTRVHPNAERLVGVLAERRQVDNARSVAELLAKAPNLDARFDEIAGEDHGTVIPAAISRAVWFMLAPALPVPAVPAAKDYLAMTPAQRYDLRLRVRDLPDRVRVPWLKELKKSLQDGLSPDEVQRLHDERNEMDAKNGTKPHAINADG